MKLTEAAKPSLSIKDVYEGTEGKESSLYDLSLDGYCLASDVKAVKAAVWSEAQGQDDLQWIDLSRNGKVFSGTVSVADHGFETGRFNIHFYASTENRLTQCIACKVIDVQYAPYEAVTYGEGFNYLAIGNSITVHSVCDFWWNEIGMAATDAGHDYFHLVMNGLKARYGNNVTGYARNFALWERAYDRDSTLKIIEPLLSDDLDLVTIMLGENVSGLSTYKNDLKKLISYIRDKAPGADIIVVGDFWCAPGREELKQRAAHEMGVKYAVLNTKIDPFSPSGPYCAGLGTSVYDSAGTPRAITDQGVAAHPENKGMKYIADKILELVR